MQLIERGGVYSVGGVGEGGGGSRDTNGVITKSQNLICIIWIKSDFWVQHCMN